MATALTWPIPLSPAHVPGLDPSWAAGLFMAVHRGIHFGPDLAFVYGPLGFLSQPSLYYSGLGAVAVLATGLGYLGSLVLFARCLWARPGPVPAIVLTLLAASATAFLGLPERMEAVFVLVALGAILADDRELRPHTAAALGALTALMGLVKLSSGAVMLAMLVVVAAVPLVRRRPRREAVAVAGAAFGSLVVAGIALWLVSGQSLADIPRYLANGREVIVGNPDNVALEEPGRGGDYVLAAVAAAALAVSAAIALRPLRPANRAVGAVLLALYGWVAFRHGFTRHDEGHVVLFFSPLLLILAALVPPRGSRWFAALPLAVAAVALGVGSMAGRTFGDLFDLRPGSTVDAAHALVSAHERGTVREGARTELRGHYGLPAAMLSRLDRHTVHVDPWEIGVAWAYPFLNWRPVPLFQSYTAYTKALDDLNADFLGSGKAPSYVLRQNIAADQRNPRFESPRYEQELICRYREVEVGAGWQLLERGPDRCGRPVQLERRHVRLGQRVPLPRGHRHDMVVARFADLSDSAWQALLGLVFKRSLLYISLPGREDRFVPGHADSPHVMTPPDCLGWDPGIFDTAAYTSVAVAHRGHAGRPEASGGYELRVYRVPFRCAGSLRSR